MMDAMVTLAQDGGWSFFPLMCTVVLLWWLLGARLADIWIPKYPIRFENPQAMQSWVSLHEQRQKNKALLKQSGTPSVSDINSSNHDSNPYRNCSFVGFVGNGDRNDGNLSRDWAVPLCFHKQIVAWRVVLHKHY